MYGKLKNIVIAGMLILTTLPFLLLTDIFPFMRFGMFAEPVKSSTQMEIFEVSFLNQSKKEIILEPKSIGIEPHFFLYISRNYYYRKEADLFLDHISSIVPTKNILELRFKRIVLPIKEGAISDTTIVAKKIL